MKPLGWEAKCLHRHITKSSCLRFKCPDNYDLEEWKHSHTNSLLKCAIYLPPLGLGQWLSTEPWLSPHCDLKGVLPFVFCQYLLFFVLFCFNVLFYFIFWINELDAVRLEIDLVHCYFSLSLSGWNEPEWDKSNRLISHSQSEQAPNISVIWRSQMPQLC